MAAETALEGDLFEEVAEGLLEAAVEAAKAGSRRAAYAALEPGSSSISFLISDCTPWARVGSIASTLFAMSEPRPRGEDCE